MVSVRSALCCTLLVAVAVAYPRTERRNSRHHVKLRGREIRQDLVYMDLPGYGPLIGKLEQTFSVKPIHAYRGLPYSRAKRFETFAAPEPWTDAFDATVYGKTCHDSDYEAADTSATCLNVNVFTSSLDGNLAPVLVYIHGGGFVWGDGQTEDLTYFLETGMVAVTLNYRLGPLGFLHTPDPAGNIPGNYGLKDQIEALRWVKKNIAAFGGDPDNVTIMGVSAGAASVDYLTLVADEDEGLFHKAITISGSATCPWAIQKDPLDNFIRYAKTTGCLAADQNEATQQTYDCLRTKDQPSMMWNWGGEFQVWAGQPFVFVPSVDGDFVKDTPENLLEAGSFVPVPMLSGIAKDEGHLVSGDSLKSLEVMAQLRDNWQAYCPFVLEMGSLDLEDAQQACEAAAAYYMNSEPVDFQNYYQFIKMAGTRLFDLPQQRSSRGHSARAPVYGYRNEYQAARGQWTFYYDGVPEEVPRLASSIPHVGEWGMIFAVQEYPIQPGEQDEWVHKFFMGAYLSFIRTGVPTIPAELNYDLSWPQFTPDSPRIQIMDKYPRTASNFATPDEEAFWVSLGL